MAEIVYLNGKLIPRRQAAISITDYGFLYGYGLFETMRAYNGEVFRLEDHLKRLSASAKILGLPVKTGELKSAVTRTIRANRLASARVRLAISAGEGEMNADPATCQSPTVLIIAQKYTPYPQSVYERGLRAVVSSIRRNTGSTLARLKSASYLESMLARQEARKAGVEEAICLNDKGFLAEASMSNIFIVSKGLLRTPGQDSGILAGITRKIVLELASQLGIPSREEDIRPDELSEAEEAFLTNSLIEVMPLTEVEGRKIGSGKRGAVTGAILKAYRKLLPAG
jgi:branched-chain amino acid aminotransferase